MKNESITTLVLMGILFTVFLGWIAFMAFCVRVRLWCTLLVFGTMMFLTLCSTLGIWRRATGTAALVLYVLVAAYLLYKKSQHYSVNTPKERSVA